jgi:transglutaminase superfamily protein
MNVQTPQSAAHTAMVTKPARLTKDPSGGNPTNCTYWLPSHVFVCETQDCVIFLDARRGKYIGVGGSDAEALRHLIGEKLPSESGASTALPSSSQLTQALDSLVARGLLTLESTSGKEFREVDLQPGSDAIGPGAGYEHKPRLTHILVALMACLGAALDLRFRGIGGTVARLIADKERERREPQSVGNPDDLRRLVCVFRLIRSFLFTKNDKCLFHALALYKFLRHYGFGPTWVIGVDVAPFSAHCWVQCGECVLDDSPAQTLLFTPIAAI